ncbi:uncharacterized protein LOC118733195 [Rhagoletis pomonella]|uniref:uncharacterized protein LOC118733195 n=1 Tax=Rhagoletis pomonella TaxID=28610 RepID=UPI001782AA03|nr:uncharacterized protein LOC118733195 [Rhagoletis pomonella]
MQLQRTVVKIPISGASGTSVACAKALAKVTIRSLQYDFEMECIALVLPRVGNITPSKHIPNTEFPELGQLKLADPKWYQPGAIDIIMSAADYAMIISDEVKQSATNGMVAQHTQLGWIIFGGLSDHKGMADTHKAQCYNTHIDLEHTLRLFWELEELNEHQTLTEDEVYCEKLFEQTTRRNSLGRYIVKLPVRKGVDLQQLAPSKQDALVLLEHTHRRLAREPELSTGYNKFMEEYRKLGHMEVSNDNNAIRMCYLPHHGVWKASSTTTKLRVVFNAARKYSTGVSLNDCLYTGPKLQNDLANILLNWRQHKFAFTGDIEKMYRQILVDREDTELQRIYWRTPTEDSPTSYTLLTVTYGTNCAPYLALKVLRRLANDEREKFPQAAKSLETEFYVDDVLSGGDTHADVINNIPQLKSLLQAGGFSLRKFNSNAIEVLNAIEPCDRDPSDSLELGMSDQTKALGIVWLTRTDMLTYSIDLDYSITCFNKRQLASDVARVFDPLGLVAPVTVRGKIFLQRLWDRKLDWGETLPQDLQHEWKSYRNELQQLQNLHIPRWLKVVANCTVELHAFSDASSAAYAAAIYIKVTTDGYTSVNLLMAKTKVAPLKRLSIPRLELCGARLAAVLLAKTKDALSFKFDRCLLWTDSVTALCWIRSSPGKLKQFVSNRVTQIQNVTSDAAWRYISTKDNPADCASRGISANNLLSNTLWWNGPAWLSLNEQYWPQHKINFPENIPETRKVTVCTVQLNNQDWLYTITTKYSSLDKLIAIIGWCLRFANKCRNKSSILTSFCTWPERYKALKILIKMTQQTEFKQEILALQQQQELSKK